VYFIERTFKAGESGPISSKARCIARIPHEVGTRMYAAVIQPGQGTYKYTSRRPLHGLLTTTSIPFFFAPPPPQSRFPLPPLPSSHFVLINASPLCQIPRYISPPETTTAPSCPRKTRCEKHAVLPPPSPLPCISHSLPVYCALCGAFSPPILNPPLLLYA
jgi:hypothetical protein